MSTAAAFGLAGERTALAWQRTALALLGSAAVMLRLTWGDLGALALILLVAAASLSAGVLLVSRSRHAQHTDAQPRARARDGRAPAALTAAITLIAVCELAALVLA